jgi:hypothetical protein
MVTECVATHGGVSLVERRLSAGPGASPGSGWSSAWYWLGDG